MSSTVAQPPASPEAGPLSEAARLIDTFVAPAKTFTDLRRSAAWWAPFLVLAIVGVCFVYVVDQKIGFRKVTENQIQASPRNAARLDQMPAADREHAIERQVVITRYVSYVYWIFILIWNLIVALILFATFKLVAGAEIKYGASLAIVMYASLPLALRSVLSMITVLAGASADSFTFQNPLGSNPGYYLDPNNSRFLYSIGSSLDVFMIWTLVLTAIGFTCISKMKRSTALAGVFGWYAVFALAAAALASAFS